MHPMDKTAFKPDTRYTLTLRRADGKPEPANLYVYRVYEEFIVARATSGSGLLRKVPYGDILKVVDETPVEPEKRYFLPNALLEEKNWKDKTEMAVYASSPALGK